MASIEIKIRSKFPNFPVYRNKQNEKVNSLEKRDNNNKKKKFKSKRIERVSSINSHLRNSERNFSVYIVKIVKKTRRELASNLPNELNLNTARFVWNDLPFNRHLLSRRDGRRFYRHTRVTNVSATIRRITEYLHFTHAEADYVSSLRDTKTSVIVLFRPNQADV